MGRYELQRKAEINDHTQAVTWKGVISGDHLDAFEPVLVDNHRIFDMVDQREILRVHNGVIVLNNQKG